MGVLHELLAAEATLRETGKATATRVESLFKSGEDRLRGRVSIYTPTDEDGQTFPSERVERATSVDDELAKYAADFGAWIDAAVQKETTNTLACAALAVESTDFGVLPATALLNLESKLAEVISVYQRIPVNDPAVPWEWDGDNGQWRSPIETRYRTEKRQEAIVLYDATPEHPAQTQLITNDVRVGKVEITVFSGALSQADRDARVERAQRLLVAVKRARAEANSQEVENLRVANKIFAYINGSKP